jgi:hypothetical protein
MNAIILAPSATRFAPDTAKIVTEQESKVTNELGIATTPYSRVQSKLTLAVGDFHPQFFARMPQFASMITRYPRLRSAIKE